MARSSRRSAARMRARGLSAFSPEARGDFLIEAGAAAQPPTGDDEDEAIPKARFDQERVRRLMAEAELQRLQEAIQARGTAAGAETQAEQEQSPEDLDQMAWEAAMEGDETKAAEYRKQAWQAIEQRAAAAVETAMEKRRAQAELQRAVTEVRAQYPALEADQALVQEVVAYRDFLYANRGVSLADALRAAAKTVAKPAAGGGGRATPSGAVDIEKMSDEEFDAFRKTAKFRKLRGDLG